MDQKKVNSSAADFHLQSGIALPTREECEQFFEQYYTPHHIREHMRQVNRVAVWIARQLIAHGENVILNLVDRASLLHDTIRVTDWPQLSLEYFTTPPTPEEMRVWESQRKKYPQEMSHSLVNFEIFKDDYPEMAQVIKMHSLGNAPSLHTWEEKIVHYADRRVAHTSIVTVQQRLDEGYARYSKITDRALERDPIIIQATLKIEKEIFSIIGVDPDALLELLNKDDVTQGSTAQTTRK